MRDRIKLLLPLFVVFVAGVGGADHAPEWLMSTAQAETMLAGIVVGVTSVGEVVRLYGPATSGGPIPDYSESEYVWDLPRSTVKVTTMHPSQTLRDEQIIYSIEVRQKEGKTSAVMTGRRVKMGYELDSLVKTYGSRYLTDWRQLSDESKTVTFIFSNETELSFGFSDEGRVIAISLIESQE